MLAILKKRGIPKCRALMVGDNVRWDYHPARAVGVDALLMESEYMKRDRQGKRIRRTIKRMRDLVDYL